MLRIRGLLILAATLGAFGTVSGIDERSSHTQVFQRVATYGDLQSAAAVTGFIAYCSDSSRSEPDSTVTVYVTPKGKKYHYRSCRTLSRSREVTALSLREAKARGYTACRVCNPPQ